MLKHLLRVGALVLAGSVLAVASSVIGAVGAVIAGAHAGPPVSAPETPAPSSVSSPPTGSATPTTPIMPTAAAAGYVPPLEGPLTVTRGFEPPSDRYASGHRGVDLAGHAAQPVRSAGAGVVVFAGMVGGRPLVSIDHPGGLRTTYEPVEPSVRAGMFVAAGTSIGSLRPGHTGCPKEACLHWGLRSGQAYLSPMSLLHQAPVRLLPLVSDRPVSN